MAQLTLLDLSTNEEIIVPPEGFVFGRVGGDADIQLEDNSISRRQARVSNRQGNWVLEVMVVPPGQRLPRPQALQQGQQFAIGTTEFEVLAMEEEEPAATIAPTRAKPGPAPVAAPIARKPAAQPPPSAQRTVAAAPQQKRPAAKPAAAPVEEDEAPADDGGGDAPAKGGIGALFVGVPKGIAYYLLNVPKLLVNPLGTVKKTIEDQPSPPIAKVGLIGYALPALFVSALLPAIGSGIGMLIGPGHIFSIGAFLPIVPAISSIIGALIYGFFFHPVLAWVITKLQGESDERSRSNFFLQTMTVTLLMSVPNALSAILVNIRWVNLLAPIISTAASLVMTYVLYQWLVFFKVHHVVPKVVAVLGALSVVFTILGLVGGVQHNLAWSTVGSSSSASDAVAAAEDAADAVDTSGMTAEQKAQFETQRALAKKAIEDAKKMAADAEKASADAVAAADKPVKADKPEKADKPAKKDPPKEEPKEVAKADPPEEKQPVAPPPPVEDKGDTSGSGSGAYGSYAHRREQVEKRLEADPTVLAADGDLQKLYGDYLADVYDIDRKYDKDRSKNPDKSKLYEHLRDAELYKKTGARLEKIAGKLGVK